MKTTRTRVPVVFVCDYVFRSRYQNTNEYVVAKNIIKYTSFLHQTLHNPTITPHPWKMRLETMKFLSP